MLSILLGLAFVLVAVAFFTVDSVVRYAGDADAVVESARTAETRDDVVDLATTALVSEMAADPDLRGIPRASVRAAVARVISPAWFEARLREVHATIVRAFDGVRTEAAIDLAAIKSHLHDATAELRDRADFECAEVLGPTACRDAQQARDLAADYQARVAHDISRLPDRIDLAKALPELELGPAGEYVEMEALRSRAADLQLVRWLGIGLLAVLLALLALVNSSSVARALTACGLVLLLAAALFGAGQLALGELPRERLTEELAEVRRQAGTVGEVEALALTTVEKTGAVVLEDAIRASVGLVALVGLIGAGAVILGALMRPRGGG